MPATEVDWLEEQAALRFAGIEKRLDLVSRQCQDRDDSPGVEMVLKLLRLIAARGRRLTEEQLVELRVDNNIDRISAVRNAIAQVQITVSDVLQAIVLHPAREMASLVQPYVRLARAVTDDDQAELIFSTSEDYTYEVWPSLFTEVEEEQIQDLAGELLRTLRAMPHVALIRYPAQVDDQTFLHAVIAHEIAHLHMAADSPGEQLVDRAFDAALPGTSFGGLAADEPRIRRLRHWFRELLCDSLAVRLIGPAFVLALIELLVPGRSLNLSRSLIEQHEAENSEIHPPSAWRILRLRDSVEWFFAEEDAPWDPFPSQIVEAKKVIDDYYSLIGKDDFGSNADEADELKLLNTAYDSLQPDGLSELLGKANYARATFQRDLPLIWEKLEQGIAPAERVRGRRRTKETAETDIIRGPDDKEDIPDGSDWSEPIDWRSILNGVYLDHLAQRRSSVPPNGAIEARRRSRSFANSTARGSIELSELHRQMLSLERQFGWINEDDR